MKILFFGDSITSEHRDYENPDDLGKGYVKIASEKLRLLYPDRELVCVNRGVGGDTTKDLLARVQKDVVDEKPDVVVMMAGINDVWRRFDSGVITTAEEFYQNYLAIVTAIKKTGARLILMQPFVFNMGDKARFRPYLNEFLFEVKRIAEEEKLTLVPIDEIFKGVTQDIPPSQFSVDGVHPTHRGCRYLADLAIKELRKELG